MKKNYIFILALVVMACSSGNRTEKDTQTTDVPDVVQFADIAGDPGKIADIHESFEFSEPDVGTDAAPDIPLKPGEAIPRPDPSLFDCSSDLSKVPDRVSVVPLSCYTDPKCHTPMVVGHRATGGQHGVIAPENTLAAVKAAIIMGVDGIEIDVRETKDGHLVLMHDDTVDRTTDGHGKVSDMTLAQIRALHVKVAEGMKGDFSCLKVPTFEEVLAMAKDRLFIDIDTKTDRVDLVVKAVEDAGMLKYATVSAGSIGKLKKARELDPDISIQVRPDSVQEIRETLDEFEPDPEVIEVQMGLIEKAAKVVNPLGLKLYTDAFPVDAVALIKGDFSGYLKIFDQGCDVGATEFPSAMLKVLGRWRWEK